MLLKHNFPVEGYLILLVQCGNSCNQQWNVNQGQDFITVLDHVHASLGCAPP